MIGRNDIIETIDRLEKLRVFDSMIDIARAGIQLRVFLYLGYNGEGALDELSKGIGERKKAICDALRKLQLKNLVVYDSGKRIYRLSDLGQEYFALLEDIVTNSSKDKDLVNDIVKNHINVNDFARQLISMRYLYEVLMVLGSSPRGEYPLARLAKIMQLSNQRAQTYLETYAPLIVAVKRPKYEKISNRICMVTYYRLTPLGLKVYRQLPSYLLIKQNRKLYTMLSRMLRNPHLMIISKRVLLLNSTINVMLVILLLLNSSLWYLIPICIFLCILNTFLMRLLPY